LNLKNYSFQALIVFTVIVPNFIATAWMVAEKIAILNFNIFYLAAVRNVVFFKLEI